MKHAINWFEIPAVDIKRAQKFYEQIFDYEMQPLDVGDELQMVMFPGEPDGVSGSLVMSEDSYKPSETYGPLLYMNANPDLQLVLDRVEEAGGKISIAKRLISEENGYMAVIIDSEGNRIALHSFE
ncbi:MAG: bleomycin resistance protein [Balneola sp.]|nr:bleomycin resistance protein [Balneola sp.]|tara:strand:+ start:10919 stop:11296 length:378 start_codon:yes stop_codon:yes gene_type:complete